jgi:hypothetical protein
VKAGPPGWQSHQVTHRMDGWIVDPADEDRIPSVVAEMIAREMPLLGYETVADIRARMHARHRKVLGHD